MSYVYIRVFTASTQSLTAEDGVSKEALTRLSVVNVVNIIWLRRAIRIEEYV